MGPLKAFGVTVTVEDYDLSVPFGSEEKSCVGAQVKLADRLEQVRPARLTLHVQAETQDGISPMAVHREEHYAYTDDLEFSLPIDIQWGRGKGGGWTPGLPNWGEEKTFVNIVIFYPPDLRFDDIQVSLVVRGDQLYIMVQRVYAGWIRDVEQTIIFIPSHPFYARPGMDPRRVWNVRGGLVALLGNVGAQMVEVAGGKPLSVPEPAKWTPPQTPPQTPASRVFATMAHYNPITNSGLAIGVDGEEFQILGHNLRGFEGPVQVPAPMSGVFLEPGQRKEGYSRTPVRSCSPYKAAG